MSAAAIIAIAVGMTLVVVGGIVGEATSAESTLSDAQDKLVGWLEDVGVDSGSAEDARDEASSATTDSVTALLHGVAGGLSALSSIVQPSGLSRRTLRCSSVVRYWFRNSGLPSVRSST